MPGPEKRYESDTADGKYSHILSACEVGKQYSDPHDIKSVHFSFLLQIFKDVITPLGLAPTNGGQVKGITNSCSPYADWPDTMRSFLGRDKPSTRRELTGSQDLNYLASL